MTTTDLSMLVSDFSSILIVLLTGFRPQGLTHHAQKRRIQRYPNLQKDEISINKSNHTKSMTFFKSSIPQHNVTANTPNYGKESAALVVLAKSRGSFAGAGAKCKARITGSRSNLDRSEVLHQVAGERNLLSCSVASVEKWPKVCQKYVVKVCQKGHVKVENTGPPVMLLPVATWGEGTRSTLTTLRNLQSFTHSRSDSGT